MATIFFLAALLRSNAEIASPSAALTLSLEGMKCGSGPIAMQAGIKKATPSARSDRSPSLLIAAHLANTGPSPQGSRRRIDGRSALFGDRFALKSV